MCGFLLLLVHPTCLLENKFHCREAMHLQEAENQRKMLIGIETLRSLLRWVTLGSAYIATGVQMLPTYTSLAPM